MHVSQNIVCYDFVEFVAFSRLIFVGHCLLTHIVCHPFLRLCFAATLTLYCCRRNLRLSTPTSTRRSMHCLSLFSLDKRSRQSPPTSRHRPIGRIRSIVRLIVAMSGELPSKREADRVLQVLLNLDWVIRHEVMSTIKRTDTPLYLRLMTMMGPDEHRLGVDEARPPSDLPAVVVAQWRPGPRQLTIVESFELSWRRRE